MSFDIEQPYDKLYRYCYFRLRSRELAEDITQEPFLRCLEHSWQSGMCSTCGQTLSSAAVSPPGSLCPPSMSSAAWLWRYGGNGSIRHIRYPGDDRKPTGNFPVGFPYLSELLG